MSGCGGRGIGERGKQSDDTHEDREEDARKHGRKEIGWDARAYEDRGEIIGNQGSHWGDWRQHVKIEDGEDSQEQGSSAIHPAGAYARSLQRDPDSAHRQRLSARRGDRRVGTGFGRRAEALSGG